MKKPNNFMRFHGYLKNNYLEGQEISPGEIKKIFDELGFELPHNDFAYNRENANGWRQNNLYPIFELVGHEKYKPDSYIYRGKGYSFTGQIYHYPTKKYIGEWNNGISFLYSTPCQPDFIKPIKKPEKQKSIESEKYPRNFEYSEQALITANYECEVDSQHITFIAKNEKPYLEGHHLIPIQFQDAFKFSLDVPENIIALCANCHRNMHLGIRSEHLKEQILIIFKKRKALLEQRGIDITPEHLLHLYSFDE